MAYSIIARRSLPCGWQRAACAMLGDGRTAWGFGATWDDAEADAVEQAQMV